jgi:hypothetical protein
MVTRDELVDIQKSIEKLSLDSQKQVLKILRNHNVELNENSNGIFVNLSFYKDSNLIDKLQDFLSHTDEQEKFINIIEDRKKAIMDNINITKEHKYM